MSSVSGSQTRINHNLYARICRASNVNVSSRIEAYTFAVGSTSEAGGASLSVTKPHSGNKSRPAASGSGSFLARLSSTSRTRQGSMPASLCQATALLPSHKFRRPIQRFYTTLEKLDAIRHHRESRWGHRAGQTIMLMQHLRMLSGTFEAAGYPGLLQVTREGLSGRLRVVEAILSWQLTSECSHRSS